MDMIELKDKVIATFSSPIQYTEWDKNVVYFDDKKVILSATT